MVRPTGGNTAGAEHHEIVPCFVRGGLSEFGHVMNSSSPLKHKFQQTGQSLTETQSDFKPLRLQVAIRGAHKGKGKGFILSYLLHSAESFLSS